MQFFEELRGLGRQHGGGLVVKAERITAFSAAAAVTAAAAASAAGGHVDPDLTFITRFDTARDCCSAISSTAAAVDRPALRRPALPRPAHSSSHGEQIPLQLSREAQLRSLSGVESCLEGGYRRTKHERTATERLHSTSMWYEL